MHEAAFRASFPCPEPLVPLDRDDRGRAVTIERYEPAGSLLPRGDGLLASSVAALTRMLDTVESLDIDAEGRQALGTVPWLDWSSGHLWPEADDVAVDLNALTEGAWIDEIAEEAAAVLDAAELPFVVGHGDFESSNVLYDDTGGLAMVHDWDSIVSLPRACLVGGAALVFPANNEPRCSTVDETDRYLDAVESLTGTVLSDTERQAAWACGTWQLAFNAKKEAARGAPGPLTEQLAEQASGRLARLRS